MFYDSNDIAVTLQTPGKKNLKQSVSQETGGGGKEVYSTLNTGGHGGEEYSHLQHDKGGKSAEPSTNGNEVLISQLDLFMSMMTLQ